MYYAYDVAILCKCIKTFSLHCAFSDNSTVSSGLNSLAAVVAEDVVKPFFNPSETKYTWITKGLGKFSQSSAKC